MNSSSEDDLRTGSYDGKMDNMKDQRVRELLRICLFAYRMDVAYKEKVQDKGEFYE